MALKPDEVEQLVTAITTKLGDNAPTVSDELSQLRSGYAGLYSEQETMAKDNEQLKADKESLILTNGKLFNQIKDVQPLGSPKQPDQKQGENDSDDPLASMLEHVEESGE